MKVLYRGSGEPNKMVCLHAAQAQDGSVKWDGCILPIKHLQWRGQDLTFGWACCECTVERWANIL